MRQIVNRNIYDNQGKLLAKKGIEIEVTGDRLELLMSKGIIDIVESDEDDLPEDNLPVIPNNPLSERAAQAVNDSSGIIVKKVDSCVRKFVSTNSNFNLKAVNRVSAIIDDILHNHRDMPWYLHLNTLFNYIDWIYSHSINVALISGMMGIEIKLGDRELADLVLGAVLHDIGMILVPKNILLKVTPLEREEIQIINKHCELGYSMLSGTDLSDRAKSISHQHHERIDGRGYPNALTIDEMTPFSQIVSIADSFDSATSYRPYKKPKSQYDVIAELQDNTRYSPVYAGVLAGIYR